MLPKLSAAFYAQKGSNPPSQPVRDWLKSLTKEERTDVGGDIQSVQFGWPIGMPLVKHLQGDLWEVRTQLASRIARVIFCSGGQHHVFVAWLYQENAQDSARRFGIGAKALESDQTMKPMPLSLCDSTNGDSP
jgi:phage-related protein